MKEFSDASSILATSTKDTFLTIKKHILLLSQSEMVDLYYLNEKINITDFLILLMTNIA